MRTDEAGKANLRAQMKRLLQHLKRIFSRQPDNYYRDCVTLDPSQSLEAWEKLAKPIPAQFNWLGIWAETCADHLSRNPDLVEAVLKDLDQFNGK